MTPNELVLTFGGLHVCVQFGENRRRNATVRVSTDGHTHTHGQTQDDFIICPMLYAIAMGQIITLWAGESGAEHIGAIRRTLLNKCYSGANAV